MLAQANSLIAKATALQNGDESVLNDAEEGTTTDNVENSSSNDVIDADAPVEEEKDDTESSDEKKFSDDEIDPDFGE